MNENAVLKTEIIGSVMVVRCPGELGMKDTLVLSERLQEIFETHADKIVFNLEGTNYLDSVGIGLILNKWKKSKTRSGDVKLCCISKFVRDIMGTLGLLEVLEIYDTEEAAIRSFENPTTPDA